MAAEVGDLTSASAHAKLKGISAVKDDLTSIARDADFIAGK